MMFKRCFWKENITKIVRPLLAALSVNGLTIPLFKFFKYYSVRWVMSTVSSRFVHSAQIPYPENLKWLQSWYALQEVKIVTKHKIVNKTIIPMITQYKSMREYCKQNYDPLISLYSLTHMLLVINLANTK